MRAGRKRFDRADRRRFACGTIATTPSKSKPHVAIIGGGPAGLRAAEVAASGGARVSLLDAMPSVGRKFLVAGKSGLNLTNDEAMGEFLDRYSGKDLPVDAWRARFDSFDNAALREWATSLGVETFVSAGGKVFPQSMKAAPLLRAWVQRLRGLGVEFHMRHRWRSIDQAGTLGFDTPTGELRLRPGATVLALGGASWPQTGSDAAWVPLLRERGIEITPLEAANVGWEVAWPQEVIEEAEGSPLKNIVVHHGAKHSMGELVITAYGLEGAPLYRHGPALRGSETPVVEIDFKPSLTETEIISRLGGVKRNFVREARRRLKLGTAVAALLKHLPDRGPWKDVGQLAAEIKRCQIPLLRPRPIAEAISTAGGIAWPALSSDLMLNDLPGVFAAGEMLDWEAPTGGYLMQACYVTGAAAGSAALEFARSCNTTR